MFPSRSKLDDKIILFCNALARPLVVRKRMLEIQDFKPSTNLMVYQATEILTLLCTAILRCGLFIRSVSKHCKGGRHALSSQVPMFIGKISELVV